MDPTMLSGPYRADRCARPSLRTSAWLSAVLLCHRNQLQFGVLRHEDFDEGLLTSICRRLSLRRLSIAHVLVS